MEYPNLVAFTSRLIILALIVFKTIKDKSLTRSGISAAVLTGFIHSITVSWVSLTLLLLFFYTGNKATRYKHDVKQGLVVSKSVCFGGSGGPVGDSGAGNAITRNHTQVFANSFTANVLIICRLIISLTTNSSKWLRLCDVGVIIHYAAVAADTFSSEIGILSTSSPLLLTLNPKTILKKVPRGTNGGISVLGLKAALLASSLMSLVACLLLHPVLSFGFCSHVLFFTIGGFVGSLVDSLLGSYLQASYADFKSSKVIEVNGGYRIFEEKTDYKLVSGRDVLDNNQVNLLMSVVTSTTFMLIYSILF